MQGICEGLAQQPASPLGVVQSSMGPALTPEWAAHISPQYVPLLPTCSDLIYLNGVLLLLLDLVQRRAHIQLCAFLLRKFIPL